MTPSSTELHFEQGCYKFQKSQHTEGNRCPTVQRMAKHYLSSQVIITCKWPLSIYKILKMIIKDCCIVPKDRKRLNKKGLEHIMYIFFRFKRLYYEIFKSLLLGSLSLCSQRSISGWTLMYCSVLLMYFFLLILLTMSCLLFTTDPFMLSKTTGRGKERASNHLKATAMSTQIPCIIFPIWIEAINNSLLCSFYVSDTSKLNIYTISTK